MSQLTLDAREVPKAGYFISDGNAVQDDESIGDGDTNFEILLRLLAAFYCTANKPVALAKP